MQNILNLINQVDGFYKTARNLNKFAEDPPNTFTMPDDDDEPDTERNPTPAKPGDTSGKLADELSGLIKDLRRLRQYPDVVNELGLIENMYRKAVQINDGFYAVKKAISNLINVNITSDEISDEDAENENHPLNIVENFLNKLNSDLTIRAKAANITKDSPEAVKQIKDTKTDLENTQLREEFSEAKSVSDLSDYDPNAVAKFDMSGGVSMEQAATKGRGYSTTPQRALKDWIASYEEEKQRYLEELGNEKDPKIVERKRKLITILDQLKYLTAKASTTYEKMQVAPEPAIQKELDALNENISTLKKERTSLKAGLRNEILTRQVDELIPLYESAKRKGDAREQFRLEQELLLRKLLRSKDVKKGAETKARKQLLAYLTGFPANPSPVAIDTLKKLMQKIEEASKIKVPIQKVWEEQGDVLREIKYEGDFEGNFKQLQQHLPNIKMGDKKQVIDKWREQIILRANSQEQIKYKSFLDAIASARASGSRSALTDAMSALYKELNNTVKQFEDKITIINDRMRRLEEQYADLQKFRGKIEEFSKNNNIFYRKKGTGAQGVGSVTSIGIKPELSENEKQQLFALINEIGELSEKDYSNPFSGAQRLTTKPLLVNLMGNMISHLKSSKKSKPLESSKPNPTVEKTDPDTGEITYFDPATKESYYKDKGPNGEIIWKNTKEAILKKLQLRKIAGYTLNKKQRKLALNNLVKKSFVDTSLESDVSQLLADGTLNSIEDPNEYAHQVFKKMLGQMDEKMKKMI